jgi:hypothetical protein
MGFPNLLTVNVGESSEALVLIVFFYSNMPLPSNMVISAGIVFISSSHKVI